MAVQDFPPLAIQLITPLTVATGAVLAMRWLPLVLREAAKLVIVMVALFHPAAERRAEAVGILDADEPRNQQRPTRAGQRSGRGSRKK
ncbi:hypothetical protein [Micromonospora lupini]|uniref:hypothetical protein n=1 Tax=Micromonospora lupini TaxID=285679 RepID=UPI0033CD79A6